MSASRDKSQKIIFLYSNLHQLYRQGYEARQRQTLPKAEVIKAGEVSPQQISQYRPPEFIQKRFQPVSVSDVTPTEHREALDGLKNSLSKLEEVQKRLRFLLQEIEEHSK